MQETQTNATTSACIPSFCDGITQSGPVGLPGGNFFSVNNEDCASKSSKNQDIPSKKAQMLSLSVPLPTDRSGKIRMKESQICTQSFEAPNLPLGTTAIRDIITQWVPTDTSARVGKPLMRWNISARNGPEALSTIEKKHRRNIYSRCKPTSIAFSHAMKHMSISEYELQFTSLSAKGQTRVKYENSAAYLKKHCLRDKYRTQES